jgi:hypothetical protein
LESRDGNIIKGTFSSRRLCAFIPREGTKLATEQKEFEERLKAEGSEEEDDEEGDEDEDEGMAEEGDETEEDGEHEEEG